MDHLIPLSLLLPGQRAEIEMISGQPDQERRLNEMGFRAGAHVEMVQSGSPCIVRIENSRVCFRECELTSIWVRARVSA